MLHIIALIICVLFMGVNAFLFINLGWKKALLFYRNKLSEIAEIFVYSWFIWILVGIGLSCKYPTFAKYFSITIAVMVGTFIITLISIGLWEWIVINYRMAKNGEKHTWKN